jgi:hypothetical protein
VGILQRRLSVGACCALLLSTIGVGQVAAYSSGCTFLNIDLWDGTYAGAGASFGPFVAGERAVVSGDLSADEAPASLELIVNGISVGTTPLPGTLVYFIPFDGDYDFDWLADGGRQATWTVSCDSAS